MFRRKLEEWTTGGNAGEVSLEVKPGEEMYLESLIRFCYSRQVTLTEGWSPVQNMFFAS